MNMSNLDTSLMNPSKFAQTQYKLKILAFRSSSHEVQSSAELIAVLSTEKYFPR